jgi:hypothetical protein
MKNKLILLLAAALGATSGMMAMNGQPGVDATFGLDEDGEDVRQQLVTTYEAPLTRALAVVKSAISELPQEGELSNDQRRQAAILNLLQEKYAGDLVAVLAGQTPSFDLSDAEIADRLGRNFTETEVAAVTNKLKREAQALNPTPAKSTFWPNVKAKASSAARGTKNWAQGTWTGYTDGYKNAQWRGKSTRVARDVIHGLNLLDTIGELAGDRNAMLDALSLNKKLNANKNFAWLRKGKSKAARALRVLITLTQAGLIGTLNHYAFKKLVKIADGRDTAAVDGADQSAGASEV